jgi:CHAT domain-containing protein/Tfp pilus assembly protein PilF
MSEKANYYNERGLEYYNKDDYARAKECFLKAKAIWKKEPDKYHPDYATILFNLGVQYKNMGNYTHAEKHYLESKTVWEKTLVKEHPIYIELLNDIGVLYHDRGNYDQAEKYYLESEDIWKRVLGKERPDYIRIINNLGEMFYDIINYTTLLNNLGGLYVDKNDYSKAIECFLELKGIWERKLGKNNPAYITLLDRLGFLYQNKWDYVHAEECYLELKSIYARRGKKKPDYAMSLSELGVLYFSKGDYARSEECYLESKNIWERLPSKEHSYYVVYLNNLGAFYLSKGDYKHAEKCFLEAKDILERIQGKKHYKYAASLNNLGMFYKDMGDYSRAKKYLLDSKNIMEKEHGKKHPDYAASLINLGSLYLDKRYYKRAEKCLLDSINILEKLCKDHPHYANSLNNLGMLYKDMGDYTRAKKYLFDSKNITEKKQGKKHPDYATSLINLGSLYLDKGYYKRAEKYYLESKTLCEQLLGKEHIVYITSLENLSMLYSTKREYKQAIAYKEEANQLNMNLINQNFTFLSGREREKYWNTYSSLFELSYSLSWFHPVQESNILNYNNALFTKGLLLRTANAVRDSVSSSCSSGDKNLIAQYDKLSNLRQQIGNLRQRGDKNEAYIKSLEDQAEKLDKSLTQASTAFKKFKADLNFNWRKVRDSLRAREAAIEFVSFKLYDKKWTATTQYAALVLRSGMDAPEWISLPHCEETLLKFLKRQNKKTHEKEKIAYDENASDLYAAVWQPLEKTLENVKSVYYSLSGLLHKISFNAIPVKEGLRLTDIYDLNFVSSTREIARRKDKTQQKPGSGVVYGGLQYTVDEKDMRREAQPYHKPDAETQEETDLSDKLREGNVLQQHWVMLPYMEQESKDIKKILSKNNIPVDLYMGAKGNKESFKNLGGKKKNVIHLSTHGFFLGDKKKNYEERERLARLGGGPKVFENPLMRSALVLAGCNNAWKGKPVTGVENGILFADDVAGMDLVGAQLVVLSACETGLGEVNNSEGVFGLQRAFKLAGAETLIMSLWGVNDQATSELMKSFYEKWLSGKSKQEAFKEAQRELRARPEYSSPFYWAAFVMID